MILEDKYFYKINGENGVEICGMVTILLLFDKKTEYLTNIK